MGYQTWPNLNRLGRALTNFATDFPVSASHSSATVGVLLSPLMLPELCPLGPTGRASGSGSGSVGAFLPPSSQTRPSYPKLDLLTFVVTVRTCLPSGVNRAVSGACSPAWISRRTLPVAAS